MNNKGALFIAFFAGLVSTLFVPTPFGRAAMLDLAVLLIAPFLFVASYRGYTKDEKRILLVALLWTFGCIFSNWWRQEEFKIAFKGDVIVFNMWCMLVFMIWLLRKSHQTFIWFMVGNGLSMVISLYYFHNGTYLAFASQAGFVGGEGVQEYLGENQVYPIYSATVIRSVLFPLVAFGGLPLILAMIAVLASAFALLFFGGSRSNFAINLLASLFMLAYSYARRKLGIFLKNIFTFFIFGVISSYFAFSLYSHFASTGALGEVQHDKFMRQIVDGEYGFLGDRDDLIRAWPFLVNHPLIGSGSSMIDRWGYMKTERDINTGLLPGHSLLTAAWVQDGIMGLFFWVYTVYLIFNFMMKHNLLFGKWAPFIFTFQCTFLWSIWASPRSDVGFYCILLALCVVAKDQRWMKQVESQLSGRRLP